MKTILQAIEDGTNTITPEELILSIMLKEHPEAVKENMKFYEQNKNKIHKII